MAIKQGGFLVQDEIMVKNIIIEYTVHDSEAKITGITGSASSKIEILRLLKASYKIIKAYKVQHVYLEETGSHGN